MSILATSLTPCCSHIPSNRFRRAIFVSLGMVHEGLLHCTRPSCPLLHSLPLDHAPRLDGFFWRLRRNLNLFGSALLHSFTQNQSHRIDGLFPKLGHILNLLARSLLHSFMRDQRDRIDCLVSKLRYITCWIGSPLFHSFTRDQHQLLEGVFLDREHDLDLLRRLPLDWEPCVLHIEQAHQIHPLQFSSSQAPLTTYLLEHLQSQDPALRPIANSIN